MIGKMVASLSVPSENKKTVLVVPKYPYCYDTVFELKSQENVKRLTSLRSILTQKEVGEIPTLFDDLITLPNILVVLGDGTI